MAASGKDNFPKIFKEERTEKGINTDKDDQSRLVKKALNGDATSTSTMERMIRLQYKSAIAEDESAIIKEWIQPKRIDASRRNHNAMCEICNDFGPGVPGIILLCIYCNVMCHEECVRKKQRRYKRRKEWICFYCLDYLDNSKQQFSADLDKLQNKSARNAAQVCIAKTWRMYRQRLYYLRMYGFIVRLQIAFRVHKQKNAFMEQVKGRMRPMKLKFSHAYDIAASFVDSSKRDQTKSRNMRDMRENFVYIMVNVLSYNKGNISQSWRVSSSFISITSTDKHLPLDARLFLGGVSGFHKIVISMFQKGLLKDTFLGQAHLDLGHGYIWKRGGQFCLELGQPECVLRDHVGMEVS